jgi:hypothetical protein
MSNLIREQVKRDSIAAAERTACMRIYKYRLEEDDGWYFFIARDIGTARKRFPGKRVVAASQGDAYSVALQALEGA